jgi:hypothetical protein
VDARAVTDALDLQHAEPLDLSHRGDTQVADGRTSGAQQCRRPMA